MADNSGFESNFKPAQVKVMSPGIPMKMETHDATDELMAVIAKAAIEANALHAFIHQELRDLPEDAFTLAMNLGRFITDASIQNVVLVSYSAGQFPRELDSLEDAKLRVEFVKKLYLGSKYQSEGEEGSMPMQG